MNNKQLKKLNLLECASLSRKRGSVFLWLRDGKSKWDRPYKKSKLPTQVQNLCPLLQNSIEGYFRPSITKYC